MRDDIKEKGLSADELYDRAIRGGVCLCTSTPHESGNKIKTNTKKKVI